jgi:hypothetical protein
VASISSSHERGRVRFQSPHCIAAFASWNTILTCATIVQRDRVEYAVSNYFTPNSDFGDRILIRFASAVAASMLTKLLWKRESGMSPLIAQKLISGTVAVIAVLWVIFPDQTAVFFHEKLQDVQSYQSLNQRFRIEANIAAAHELIQAFARPRMAGGADV